MQAKFKQNFMIDGNFYGAGTPREVPDSFKKNWFFQSLVNEGKAEIISDNAGAKKPVPPSAPVKPSEPQKTGKASEAKG